MENKYGRERCHLLAATGEAAAGAAERFPEGAGDDVDFAHHVPILVRAAPRFPKKSGGMRIVDHGQRVIFFGKIANAFQVRDCAVHRKTAVGRGQTKACIFRGSQLRFEIGHVVVLITEALRFAETDTVDDAGVIEFVTDHGVFVGKQRFEQTAVGVEA